MNRVNNDELTVFRYMLRSGTRLDGRSTSESRTYDTKKNCLPLYDASINVSLGNSELALYFRYSETSEIVETSERDSVTFDDFFLIKDRLYKLFDTFKLGCVIEYKVLRNDGSLLSLFYNAFNVILRGIKLPYISGNYDFVKNQNDNILFQANNSNYYVEMDSINAITYGLIDDLCITDPSFVEEEASDAILTVLYRNDTMNGLYLFSKHGITLETFENFLVSKDLLLD